MNSSLPRLFLCAVVALLAACVHSGQGDMHATSQAAPVRGFVTDTTAFEKFIARHPTADEFRAAYPDVVLVLPGMPTTMEMRYNNSRYFAEIGGDGRISGGRFQ